MLNQLLGSQFALDAALAELVATGGDTAIVGELRSQLAVLSGLREQIGSAASGTTLAALRADVAATTGTAASIAQQARTAAATSAAELTQNLVEAATASRLAVASALDSLRHIPLTFTSPEDEAAYRTREEERRAYIAAEQAKGTPQGDLNAAGGTVGQMADAAAHGAAESPEFQKRWDALTASTEALRAQLIRNGKDVSQFDAHLREDLRAIMRAKGVPDAQIDALLAANPDNPLEAVKAFVAEQKGVIGEKEIDGLVQRTSEYKDGAEEKPAVASVSAPQASVPASALDAMADLKALGVVAGEHDTGSPPVHGVTASVAVAANQGINARS